MRWLHSMLCAAVALVLLAPTAALARPTRVAFIKIDGDTRGLRRAVIDALDESEVDVAPNTRVSRTIARLGLEDEIEDELGNRELKKLAAELEVDAVVQGSFDRRRHKLRFTIYADGKKSRPFQIEVRDPKSDRFRKRVRTLLAARLAAVTPAEGPAASEAAPKHIDFSDDSGVDDEDLSLIRTRPRQRDEQRAGSGERGSGKRVAAREDDGSGVAAGELRATARASDSAGRGTHNPGLAAARVDAGLSMIGRQLRFTSTAMPNAPGNYRNSPVPGARFEGELYPLALRHGRGRRAGLGVAADFDQAFSLTVRGGGDAPVSRGATERRYSVGLRYRLALGRPVVTFGIGYGVRSFEVDRAGLQMASEIDMPDVTYKHVDPGVAFRLPLGSRLAVTLAGRALLVTSAGSIQRVEQYGRSTIFGGSATAGLELLLAQRFAVRLAGEFTQIALTFDGTGMQANNRDGDATTVDVKGATDRYYGGAATFGILY